MGLYLWKGKTRTGDKKKGEIEAPSLEAAEQKLRQKNIIPTKVKKKPKDIILKMPGSSGVKPKELMVFTRQFSAMIDAGLPLVQALDILVPQQENPIFKEILMNVRDDVQQGSTLADALAKHPKVFDSLFTNLVAAGEQGGILDTIMGRLAQQIEKGVKLTKQIKGAMVYPTAVLVVAFIAVAALLIFVIPVFEEMFAEMGQELPAFTQLVINMSHGFMKYWYVVVAVPILFGVLWKQIRGTPTGRLQTDKMFLSAPIFGNIIRKGSVAGFTRTMSTMVSSGVPILDSLEVVARANSNQVISQGILYARQKVAEGSTLSEPLEQTGIFPNMVTQMVHIGESTGALDDMLGKIADFYEEEVDAAVAGLASLLEPLLMVFLAVVVGGFLIAMYLPIFSMAGAVAG